MDNPLKIPVEDILDLHTFRPNEIANLLDDYFEECIKKGIFSVRVIHGKGRGILKRSVYSLLEKNPKVISFKQALPDAGGWGAVIVELKEDKKHNEAKV